MSSRIPPPHPLPLAVTAGIAIANARDAASTLDRVTWALLAVMFVICSWLIAKSREAKR